MRIETYARTAALILTIVLVVGLYARQQPAVAAGYYFYLLEDPPPSGECPFEGDTRTVVLQMLSDGSIKINQDQASDSDFASLLAEIYRTRAEKIIFVMVDLDVPYRTFITRIDELKEHVPGMYMVLITPSWPAGPCSLHVRNADRLFTY